MATIYIPRLNPIKILEDGVAANPQYHGKHIEHYFWQDRVQPWQQYYDQCQPVQTTDIVALQFYSDFSPIVAQLLDADGVVVNSLVALQQIPIEGRPGFYAYQISQSMAGLDEGCYRFGFLFGPTGSGQKIAYSNTLYVADKIAGTMLLEYSHPRHHEDVAFETGIVMQYRTYGHIDKMLPGMNMTAYEDQRANPITLSAVPFNTYEVFFNGEYGANEDHIDLLNRIWTCRDVLVDGKPIAPLDGGKMEFIEVEGSAMRGVKMKLQDGVQRASTSVGLGIDPLKKLLSSVYVDLHAFGNQAGAFNNTVPVNYYY